MKKYIFLLLLSFYQLLNAQVISLNNLTVSQSNSNEIQVRVNVFTDCGTYLANSYNINNNIITLDMCYYLCDSHVIVPLENDVYIPIPINGNYTLIVNLYNSTSETVCDYNSVQGSATLQFSTPLTSPIVLSAGSFDPGDVGVRVTPNPTQGLIILDFGNKPEAVTVSVANTLGQEISRGVYAPAASLPIMIEGASGVYFVTVSSSRGRETFKVVRQ
jgi:hypothetical protein